MMPAMLHMTCSPPWRAAMWLTSVSRRAPRRHVELRALGAAALPEDGRRRLRRGGGVDVGAHHGGAGAGQHLGRRAPDAAAGPGDQGHPARQVERVADTLGGFHRRTLGRVT